MIWPLILFAAFAAALGFVGTPAWPWFHAFLTGHSAEFNPGRLFDAGFLALAAKSALIVFAGIGLGWWWYGRKPRVSTDEPDVLETARPDLWALLKNKYFVDEFYERTVIRLNGWFARFSDLLDRWVFGGLVELFSYITQGVAWVDRAIDEFVINLGFDGGCRGLRRSGGIFSRIQAGRVQAYLRLLGLGVVVLVAVLILWRN